MEETKVQTEENSGNPVEAKTEDLAKELEKSAEKADDGAKKENDGEEQKKETEIPAELQDKYKAMQRDYTDKTTKLSEREKQFESEREKLAKDSQTLSQLISNPKFIAWYNAEIEKEKGEVKKEVVAEEPLTADILNDADALAKYLAKRDEAILKKSDEKYSSLKSELATQRLTNDISDYASDKENNDFWSLRDLGLIRDEDITSVALKNPKKDNIEVLKIVHETARSKYNTIVDNATNRYKEQEKKVIEQKKSESIDSGRGGTPSSKSVTPKDFKEMLIEESRKMGMGVS